jgi:hypothetical protein
MDGELYPLIQPIDDKVNQFCCLNLLDKVILILNCASLGPYSQHYIFCNF